MHACVILVIIELMCSMLHGGSGRILMQVFVYNHLNHSILRISSTCMHAPILPKPLGENAENVLLSISVTPEELGCYRSALEKFNPFFEVKNSEQAWLNCQVQIDVEPVEQPLQPC